MLCGGEKLQTLAIYVQQLICALSNLFDCIQDEISKMREANEVLFQEKENLLNKVREICASQQKIEAKFKNGLDASEARSLQHQNKVVTTQLNDAHREIEKHKEIAGIATSQVCSLNAINENLVNEINGMQVRLQWNLFPELFIEIFFIPTR